MSRKNTHNQCIAANNSEDQIQSRNQSGTTFTGGDQNSVEQAKYVKLKSLPFYEIQDSIFIQRCLIASQVTPVEPRNGRVRLRFKLTPDQCSLLSSSREMITDSDNVDFGYQLQLRFGLLDTATEQDDDFPPNLLVTVNGRRISLPPKISSPYADQPPRQPAKPLNITSKAKLRPRRSGSGKNKFVIHWQTDDTDRNWVVSINIVKKLSWADLFRKLTDKAWLKPKVTGKLIDSFMKSDELVMTPTRLKVSVTCPLGKSRMEFPCRSIACSHIQCFDARLYLQMNEKSPKWACPVCNQKILYDDLAIDGFFIQVIKDLKNSTTNDIEINPDWSWKQVEVLHGNKSVGQISSATSSANSASALDGSNEMHDETISIDDESRDSDNDEEKENRRKSLRSTKKSSNNSLSLSLLSSISDDDVNVSDDVDEGFSGADSSPVSIGFEIEQENSNPDGNEEEEREGAESDCQPKLDFQLIQQQQQLKDPESKSEQGSVDVDQSNKKRIDWRAIFVRNIPPEMNESIFKEFFSTCGKIDSVHIIRRTHWNKGHGFINFRHSYSAKMALKTDWPKFKGQLLLVHPRYICNNDIRAGKTSRWRVHPSIIYEKFLTSLRSVA